MLVEELLNTNNIGQLMMLVNIINMMGNQYLLILVIMYLVYVGYIYISKVNVVKIYKSSVNIDPFDSRHKYNEASSNECKAINRFLLSNNLIKKSIDLGDCNNIIIKESVDYDGVKVNSKVDSHSEEHTRYRYYDIEIELISEDKNKVDRFIKKCLDDYEKHLKMANNGNIYHFIYYGGRPRISTTLFKIGNKSNETFDTIFHPHKAKIIRNLDNLANAEYYKKRGLKRKISYIFCGVPGSGKTSTVMAIANHLNRHIYEISLSRVDDNDFDNMFSDTTCEGNSINMKTCIYLFDEIDFSMMEKNTVDINKFLKKKKKNDNSDDEDNTEDGKKFNLGTFLSRTDGIGSYDGAIFIATCNNLKDIPEAVYRDGRFELINFTYMVREDIFDMLKYHYCECGSNDRNEIVLPDVLRENISAATLSKIINNSTLGEALVWLEGKK